MKRKISAVVNSTRFIILLGLVIVPVISFMLITVSEESPLYTSISRLAWVLDYWWLTFAWGIIIMASILWLTYKTVSSGPLDGMAKKAIIISQFINIAMVFIGCLAFPAKSGVGDPLFVNYLHDYMTIIAWVLYGIGLIVYSLLLRGKDSFLSFLGLGLMSFTVFSSLFFVRRVILPDSYVGASAVSEVHIINSLFIYLVVMYVAQEYAAGRLTSASTRASTRKNAGESALAVEWVQAESLEE